MSEYVIDVLRRDLAHPSQREWLARLSEREPVETGEDSAALVNAAREARKQELEAACRCR